MFPEDFLWGVSISGFQFEMGNKERKYIDDKSDWFVWVHDQENIRTKLVSGDFPEDGINYWELYEKDHQLARNLGLNAFRLNIEWSRIFPEPTFKIDAGVEREDNGYISKIDIAQKDLEELENNANLEALKHYEQIIKDITDKEMKVLVCLNHFTLPLWIHDPIVARKTKIKKGALGWIDEKTVIEFCKYAAFIAWKLGNLVDFWITFNEPMVVVEMGYAQKASGFPPGVENLNAMNKAAINLAIAHARSYDLIKKFDTYKADNKSPSSATVGIVSNMIPFEPMNKKSKADVSAANFMDFLHNRFIIEAITSGQLIERLQERKNNKKERRHLANRLDWIGINYYSRAVVRGKFSLLAKSFIGIDYLPELVEGYGLYCKPNSLSIDKRETSDFGWEFYPEGLQEVIEKTSKFKLPVYITENGVADSEDKLRSKYIFEHLRIVEDILNTRKFNLKGYFHWSLIDNYEWAKGFSMKFGLFEVDLKTKERKMRKSAMTLRNIVEQKTTYF
ncbi:MAG: beta-galactosidase BgaS [Thermoproteota archaeon]|nr:glycoside hydrolase family 1 protein [Candidatus Brockarchaeota archaeon]MBO3768679.1 glycoside hydrolase family 1 protein [Candidatus Brockarchaeota archaeon]MBO3801289.1 glycoside hydrolase family 1 protein [Candidatus Brockarchaeota archaeon]